MKTYAIVIQPGSPFGTPLKGDTIFGHFCWQIANDPALISGPFEEAVRTYHKEPFAIFSSAFPWIGDGAWVLKRPDAPLDAVADLSSINDKERIERRKELKKKVWVVCERPHTLDDFRMCQLKSDRELAELAGLDGPCFMSTSEVSHNTINRLTGTTGEGYPPFTQESTVYRPGSRLVIFVAIDEKWISPDTLVSALERIGTTGFGRDASTGQGRFSLVKREEIDLRTMLGANAPNALYTLAPSVPVAEKYRDALFTPFTRYGRHGDRLAVSGKPFKNPFIMADEGALLFPYDMSDALRKPYLGCSVTGISKILPETIAQGYTLYIPVRLEVKQ